MATANLTLQNFFSTTLSSGINATDTTIPLNALPSGTEGFLVIEPDNETAREIIYYTSKTGSAVLCPSAGTGRGQDGTTATSHSGGATVKMTVTAGYWRALQDMSAITAGSVGAYPFATGWGTIPSVTPSTVTYNGNRSYDLVFNSTDLTGYISPGMRLRTSRTVAAPTQCTSLNGTTQYYSRASASIAGTLSTITDDITIMAWVKPSSYALGGIVSRTTATNGWTLRMNADGTIEIFGLNASAFRAMKTYQSLPLNKWTHIAVSFDMSGLTTTTCKAMFDGVDVPVVLTTGAPTAWVNSGGDLNIGAANGATPFAGKIAQVWIGNGNASTITQSTIRGYITQGVSGSETNCIGAWSFNNSITDLTASANNLTAQGSAVATNADSPFTVDANGTPGGTYDYAIVQKATYSGGNTTLVVQCAEGTAIPTSGGVSAVAYSSVKAPFGMPISRGRWTVQHLYKSDTTKASPAASTWYNTIGTGLVAATAPVGDFTLLPDGAMFIQNSTNQPVGSFTFSTTDAAESDAELTARTQVGSTTANYSCSMYKREKDYSYVSATPIYANVRADTASATSVGLRGTSDGPWSIKFIPSNL